MNFHFFVTKCQSADKAIKDVTLSLTVDRVSRKRQIVLCVGNDGSVIDVNDSGFKSNPKYDKMSSFSGLNDHVSAVLRGYKNNVSRFAAAMDAINKGNINTTTASLFTDAGKQMMGLSALADRDGNCDFDITRESFMPWQFDNFGVTHIDISNARGCHYVVVVLVE